MNSRIQNIDAKEARKAAGNFSVLDKNMMNLIGTCLSVQELGRFNRSCKHAYRCNQELFYKHAKTVIISDKEKTHKLNLNLKQYSTFSLARKYLDNSSDKKKLTFGINTKYLTQEMIYYIGFSSGQYLGNKPTKMNPLYKEIMLKNIEAPEKNKSENKEFEKKILANVFRVLLECSQDIDKEALGFNQEEDFKEIIEACKKPCKVSMCIIN